jgi:anaerobic selenocysteine-containing dehydrogenase
MLTGSFGRKGTNQLHSWLVPLWGNSPNQRFAAADIEVIGGLLPPNLFPDAVLSDHADRLRAVWIDSSNPANTASNTARVEKALRALDLVVVVDVAMTETARLAHYVLPASSQYEKTEFTLFNFEFPRNYFHVRAGVVAPLAGTLPEPEIYTRLSRALGLLPGDNALAPLRESAFRSRLAFAAELRAFMGANPQLAALGTLVLYNTLGATLPDGTAAAAPLWQAAHLCTKRSPQAVRRALNAGRDVPDEMLGEALFDAIVGSRNGAAFTEHDYDEVWSLVSHPDHKVHLAIAPMLEWLGKLDPVNAVPRGDYPFVLAAGQRRMFNANQIFRDPAWRRDDPDGALLISAADLASLGAEDGEWIAVQSAAGRVVARCKRDDSMRSGQLALPHGYGQDYPAADGERLNNGPRVNVLTESGNRDPIAGTPYHKHVPVRLERLAAAEAAAYEAASRRIHPASA